MTITVPPSPNTPMTGADGLINPVWDQWFNYLQTSIANSGGPILAVNAGGTGQGSFSDGQLLVGNSNGATLSVNTLTAGSGIGITNGHGTITIAATGTTGTANGGTGVASPTAHTLPVAEGSSAFNFLGPLTNGQLLIGSTGADPSPSTLTAGQGISISNAAGTITVAQTNLQIRTVQTQTFTSSGTYTPTSGMVYCIAEGVGGGGGGGGGNHLVSNNILTVGGSGGSYARVRLTAAQIGVSQTVTIGAGGAGGVAVTGSNGTDTSLGTLLVAKGGTGGAGGQPAIFQIANNITAAVVGQAGTTGGTGDVVIQGGASTASFGTRTNTGAVMINISYGGDSYFGRGGIGIATTNAGSSNSGNQGNNYGGGASGTFTNASTDANGTNGANGILIITEFCT